MDKVESKLNKLDKIDTLVTSLNSKVTKLEVTTKSSDGRIDQVEKSTQLISD
jgi:outer membrane murein-binding lipoprotein Lpp